MYPLRFVRQEPLAPAEAVRTATLNPAVFLNLEAGFGSVTTGKAADLLLRQHNPLENIEHIRSIKGVIWRGNLIDEQERSKRLKAIRKTLNQ